MNLGLPYEAIVKRTIEKGYAASQTEVVRQALIAYDRMLEEEEYSLVHKAAREEMAGIKSGEVKTYSLKDLKKSKKGR
jgi:Arc/MetJ-type ribon-helix-helix transcriptional regulator